MNCTYFLYCTVSASDGFVLGLISEKVLVDKYLLIFITLQIGLKIYVTFHTVGIYEKRKERTNMHRIAEKSKRLSTYL